MNATGLLDNAGEREPWIELLNAGPLPVSLEGWYLTDSFTDLTKWPFPAGFTLEGASSASSGRMANPPKRPGPMSTPTSDSPTEACSRWSARRELRPRWSTTCACPHCSPTPPYGSLPDGQDLIRDVLDPPTPGERNRFVPAPEIVNVRLHPSDGLSFEWASVPGVRYRVEGTFDPASHSWVTLAEAVAQDAGMRYSEPLGVSRRFYRIVVP